MGHLFSVKGHDDQLLWVTCFLVKGQDDQLLWVTSSGLVVWDPAFSMETSCEADITFYPYDEQTCHWDIFFRMMDTRHVQFAPPLGVAGVFGKDSSSNAEWDIVGVANDSCDILGTTNGVAYVLSCIRYR